MTELERISRELQGYTDEFDRLNALIAYSAKLSQMCDALTTDENLIRGCQSKVWARLERRGGALYLEAYSDTRIIRGVLALLKLVIDGSGEEVLQSLDDSFLKRLGIDELLSANRRSGIHAILSKFKGLEMC